jgi:hypothetical protein
MEDLGNGEAEEAEGWDMTKMEKDDLKQEFQTTRPGDYFLAPFQCHCCHFVNITKRDPVEENHLDKWALTTIIRANLYVFWSSRLLTMYSNLSKAKISL